MNNAGLEQSPEDIDSRSVIELLGMERHRAGGWYSMHYADSEIWGRARFSSMYYLLPGDEVLPMHKLDSVAVWHFHLGAPAEFTFANGGDCTETVIVGNDLLAGQRTQVAVPQYDCQSIRSLGKFTLLGCTMSPGYSAHALSFATEGD